MREIFPQTLQVNDWNLDCRSGSIDLVTLQKYLLCSSFAGADCSAGISEGSPVYQTFLAGSPVQIQILREFVDNHNYSEACIHSALDCCDC